MSLAQIQQMFDEDLDYVICKDHKTSSTYGSLAKWFPQGMLLALKAYIALPRPEHCGLFLVPPNAMTEKVITKSENCSSSISYKELLNFQFEN